MANTVDLQRIGAVGFIDWLDFFGFHRTLCMILKYPSSATQQEADNYDADDRARRGMRDEPLIKLQDDDKDQHGDNRELATAKNEKRENARDGSYTATRQPYLSDKNRAR